jgi:hypothetical protein
MPKRRTKKAPPRHSPRSDGAKRHHAGRDTEAEIRVLVFTRAGGRCEKTGVEVAYSSFACHHRKLKSQGGSDGPENRGCLSTDAHTAGPDAVHRNPRAAQRDGWIVLSTEDPAKLSVLLYDGRRVHLTADGRYEPASSPTSPGLLAGPIPTDTGGVPT